MGYQLYVGYTFVNSQLVKLPGLKFNRQGEYNGFASDSWAVDGNSHIYILQPPGIYADLDNLHNPQNSLIKIPGLAFYYSDVNGIPANNGTVTYAIFYQTPNTTQASRHLIKRFDLYIPQIITNTILGEHKTFLCTNDYAYCFPYLININYTNFANIDPQQLPLRPIIDPDEYATLITNTVKFGPSNTIPLISTLIASNNYFQRQLWSQQALERNFALPWHTVLDDDKSDAETKALYYPGAQYDNENNIYYPRKVGLKTTPIHTVIAERVYLDIRSDSNETLEVVQLPGIYSIVNRNTSSYSQPSIHANHRKFPGLIISTNNTTGQESCYLFFKNPLDPKVPVTRKHLMKAKLNKTTHTFIVNGIEYPLYLKPPKHRRPGWYMSIQKNAQSIHKCWHNNLTNEFEKQVKINCEGNTQQIENRAVITYSCGYRESNSKVGYLPGLTMKLVNLSTYECRYEFKDDWTLDIDAKFKLLCPPSLVKSNDNFCFLPAVLQDNNGYYYLYPHWHADIDAKTVVIKKQLAINTPLQEDTRNPFYIIVDDTTKYTFPYILKSNPFTIAIDHKFQNLWEQLVISFDGLNNISRARSKDHNKNNTAIDFGNAIDATLTPTKRKEFEKSFARQDYKEEKTTQENFVIMGHSPRVITKNSPHVIARNSLHVTSRNSPYVTPRNSPHVTPRNSLHVTPRNSPYVTPRNSPHVTPRNSPHITPRNSPHVTPIVRRSMVRRSVAATKQSTREPNNTPEGNKIEKLTSNPNQLSTENHTKKSAEQKRTKKEHEELRQREEENRFLFDKFIGYYLSEGETVDAKSKLCGFFVPSNGNDNTLYNPTVKLNQQQYHSLKSRIDELRYNVIPADDLYKITTAVRLLPGWYSRSEEYSKKESEHLQIGGEKISSQCAPHKSGPKLIANFRYDEATRTTYYSDPNHPDKSEIACYHFTLTKQDNDLYTLNYYPTLGVMFDQMKIGQNHEVYYRKYLSDVDREKCIRAVQVLMEKQLVLPMPFFQKSAREPKAQPRYSATNTFCSPTPFIVFNPDKLGFHLATQLQFCKNFECVQPPGTIQLEGESVAFPGFGFIKLNQNTKKPVLFKNFEQHNLVLYPTRVLGCAFADKITLILNHRHYYKPHFKNKCLIPYSISSLFSQQNEHALALSYVSNNSSLPLCFNDLETTEWKNHLIWLNSLFEITYKLQNSQDKSDISQHPTTKAQRNHTQAIPNSVVKRIQPQSWEILENGHFIIQAPSYYESIQLPGLAIRPMNTNIEDDTPFVLELFYNKKAFTNRNRLFEVMVIKTKRGDYQLHYFANNGQRKKPVIQALPLQLKDVDIIPTINSAELTVINHPTALELQWFKGLVEAVNQGVAVQEEYLYEPIIAYDDQPHPEPDNSPHTKHPLTGKKQFIMRPYVKRMKNRTFGLAYPANEQGEAMLYRMQAAQIVYGSSNIYESRSEQKPRLITKDYLEDKEKIENFLKNPFQYDHLPPMILRCINEGSSNKKLRFQFPGKTDTENSQRQLCYQLIEKASGQNNTVLNYHLEHVYNSIYCNNGCTNPDEPGKINTFKNFLGKNIKIEHNPEHDDYLRCMTLRINREQARQNELTWQDPACKNNNVQKQKAGIKIIAKILLLACFYILKSLARLLVWLTGKLFGLNTTGFLNAWHNKLAIMANDEFDYYKIRSHFTNFAKKHPYVISTLKGIAILVVLSFLLSIAVFTVYSWSHTPTMTNHSIRALNNYALINTYIEWLHENMLLAGDKLFALVAGINALSAIVLGSIFIPIGLYLKDIIKKDQAAARAHDSCESIHQLFSRRYNPESTLTYEDIKKHPGGKIFSAIKQAERGKMALASYQENYRTRMKSYYDLDDTYTTTLPPVSNPIFSENTEESAYHTLYASLP